MEVLKDYPKEFAKLLLPSFNFLSRVNMKFFPGNDDFAAKYWRFLYVIPCLVLNYVTVALQVGKMAARAEIFEIANLLPPFLVSTQAILKGMIIYSKIPLLSNIISELGDLWRTTGLNEVQIREREALLRKVNFCIGVTYWIAVLGTSQYSLTPLLETLLRRFVLGQDCDLLLPFAGSYPFDPTANWIVYGATYIFQFYCMFLFIFSYIGAELILISLCALTGMEFTLLCEDMVKVKPESNIRRERPNDEEFTIKDFVKRHQRLCVVSAQLDEAFNQMIFINVLSAGITTCFFRCAAQFARGLTYMLSNYTGVISSLLYVLYLCYFGELLTGASLRVGDVAYHNLWYKGNKQYQKKIFIIIKRSQKPSCLTSMKYAKVTLNMFTSVISTTWSYLSLMNTVYVDEN